jgi:hypothetical protein
MKYNKHVSKGRGSGAEHVFTFLALGRAKAGAKTLLSLSGRKMLDRTVNCNDKVRFLRILIST